RASKRSLIVWYAVSGQVPCSGAKRRDKVLDEVSTAILGDAVAENQLLARRIPIAQIFLSGHDDKTNRHNNMFSLRLTNAYYAIHGCHTHSTPSGISPIFETNFFTD
ncbi:MAG: hypothetical protein L6365_20925, partial [Desulfobulbaceae bacterium]|nr:hypothetical protein [Pseudomonadota bacterium]MCG2749982.1 hypothetical protein [Desulfobulbaceae bacterium]